MPTLMVDKEVKQILAAILQSKPDKFFIVKVAKGNNFNRYWFFKKIGGGGVIDNAKKALAVIPTVASSLLGGVTGLGAASMAIDSAVNKGRGMHDLNKAFRDGVMSGTKDKGHNENRNMMHILKANQGLRAYGILDQRAVSFGLWCHLTEEKQFYDYFLRDSLDKNSVEDIGYRAKGTLLRGQRYIFFNKTRIYY